MISCPRTDIEMCFNAHKFHRDERELRVSVVLDLGPGSDVIILSDGF